MNSILIFVEKSCIGEEFTRAPSNTNYYSAHISTYKLRRAAPSPPACEKYQLQDKRKEFILLLQKQIYILAAVNGWHVHVALQTP